MIYSYTELLNSNRHNNEYLPIKFVKYVFQIPFKQWYLTHNDSETVIKFTF